MAEASAWWRIEVSASTLQARRAAKAALHAAGIEATVLEWWPESITFHAGPATSSALDECLGAAELAWDPPTPLPRPDFRDLAILRATRLLASAQEELRRAIEPPDPARERLLEALRDAYAEYDHIDQMLDERVGIRLTDLCPPAAIPKVWLEVHRHARRFDWEDRLLCGAWRGNLHNPLLRPLMTGEFAHCAKCRITRGDWCPQLDTA